MLSASGELAFDGPAGEDVKAIRDIPMLDNLPVLAERKPRVYESDAEVRAGILSGVWQVVASDSRPHGVSTGTNKY